MTLDSILEAAIQVLERAGPEGFNTNAVAERAGVSVGTLYQYFADKEAILLAAAQRAAAEPVTPLHKTLMTALARALEQLLTSGRCAIRAHGRRASAAIAAERDRLRFQIERAVQWALPPMPAYRTVRVHRSE